MSEPKPMEVEAKFRVPSPDPLRERLKTCSASVPHLERHRDTYLSHPCRDFRITDEALRIREIDGQPWITYKGPRLEGPIKIRPERELQLLPKDIEGWQAILDALGFSVVASVLKRRESYRLDTPNGTVTVTIDDVEHLGTYAEVERVVDNQDQVELAKQDIEWAADHLGLIDRERRSYLSMLLEMQR